MPNRGLVSFTCGPLWTVNPCPFFSCHSWFYRPSSYPPLTSPSRMNFGSQLSWSILIWKGVCVFDHSCFASLNLTHFYYMLSELGGGAGEPQRVFEVNHGLTQWHDKILWFVLYLFPSNIYYLIYLFDCCWTLWLHFHGTIYHNYKMLLITESPVFHIWITLPTVNLYAFMLY